MDIQIGNLNQLYWLWVIPVCLATAIVAIVARSRARRRFATANLLGRLVPDVAPARFLATSLLVMAVIGLLTLALIDVRWGRVSREVPQKGIEVVFVLDVSRSMLAEDTTPNRLERAKEQIKDTIDEMAGDRVALVVFAGSAQQTIPMTSHYDDFKQSLDAVGVHSVPRGGSRLGDAITVATKSFLTKTNDHKAMIILTDGEDQESKPIEAARDAFADHGIRVFTIGLGDIGQGARIPVRTEASRQYLQHDGQQVWSKLNGQVLKEIAAETQGAYIPAGTKRVNMSDVYHGYVANVEQEEFDTAKIQSYEARFQWFVGAALLLLLSEVLFETRRRRRDHHLMTDQPDDVSIRGSSNSTGVAA